MLSVPMSCIGVISQQGSQRQPSSISAKLIFLFGYIFSLLVFYGFSAHIVAFLASSESIKSVEELVEYGGIR